MAYVNSRLHREWDEYAEHGSNAAANKRRTCQVLSSVRRKCKCGEYQDVHPTRRRNSSGVGPVDLLMDLEEPPCQNTTCSDDNGDAKSPTAQADSIDLESGKCGDCEKYHSEERAGRFGFVHRCFEGSSCPICLSDYNPTDMVCELKCGHLFHEECLLS